jgi:hypothetical protein
VAHEEIDEPSGLKVAEFLVEFRSEEALDRGCEIGPALL